MSAFQNGAVVVRVASSVCAFAPAATTYEVVRTEGAKVLLSHDDAVTGQEHGHFELATNFALA